MKKKIQITVARKVKAAQDVFKTEAFFFFP